MSRLGCLITFFFGWGTPFSRRGASCLEAHGMVIKVDSTYGSIGLVLSGFLVTMLVCSVGRGPTVTLGTPILLDSIDDTDLTFSFPW